MRSCYDPKSSWKKQLRFDAQEFETMMDELRVRSGGDCFRPSRGIDVDLAMWKSFGVEPDFVDLPAGILGRTKFFSDGKILIEVSRSLSDLAETDVLARRRLRTTLAHECGHVACHSCLYVRDSETLSMFPVPDRRGQDFRTAIMCRQEGVGHSGYRGEWWEYQANQCMAALLLPRTLFSTSVRRELAECGVPSFEEGIRQGRGEELVRALSREYDVSGSATLYRLQALGFVSKGLQTSMRFPD
jgi:hypothetical protein